MAAKSDELLINNTLRGASEDFEELINRYGQIVERYVRSIINDPLDVQDISQEIWMIAYQRLDSLRDQTKFLNWILVISRNKCRAHLHVHAVDEVLLAEDLTPNPYHPEDEHVQRAKKRRLHQAVDALSQKLKRTVTMHYLTGYTCLEVSTGLNVPVGTVKRRLADARKELKRIFKNWSQQSGQDSIGVRSLMWIAACSYGIGCLSDLVAFRIS